MSKILIDRHVLKQILKTIESWNPTLRTDDDEAAITALCQALEQEPLTDTYVQEVSDKCDRIVWRGHYFHLPVSSTSKPEQEQES